MLGAKVWLNRHSAAPRNGLVWVWRFRGADSYSLRAEDGAWDVTRGEEEGAVVTVDATAEDWALFLTTPREKRRLPTKDISLEGSRREVRKFAMAFAAKLAAG
jgi:hypothetical protein